jgi:ubiquitin carboxyl-terminal hydrolase 7
MNPEYSVSSISEYITIVAERIPEEDVNVDPAHFIQAFHFQGEPNKPHGFPFKFSIQRVSQNRKPPYLLIYFTDESKDEKFSETRKRLEKRTGIKGKNFDKIKFAVVKRSSYSKPTYLEDGTATPILLFSYNRLTCHQMIYYGTLLLTMTTFLALTMLIGRD